MDKLKKNHDSALSVQKGVDAIESIGKEALERFRKIPRKQLTVSEFVDGIRNGNRAILAKAITLIESDLDRHREMAQEIISACLPFANSSYRIGITGVPGVGKSTLIEAIGQLITDKGHRLAVLAVDPSSERSHGSILGDKTRMELLATNPNAFIRPSPSSGSLGGVAQKTRETIILCEAAGFDIIFVETVGVGQSEISVHGMVDMFLLLMLAGAGDELQGIKRGIMEMADALIITKADGNNAEKAEMAKQQYINALHLFPPTSSLWIPKVMTASAVENKSIMEIWDLLSSYFEHCKESGFFEKNRREQALKWMYDTINEKIMRQFYQNPLIKSQLDEMAEKVLTEQVSPQIAASELIKLLDS